MRVTFVSVDTVNDPLVSSGDVPERLHSHFVPNAERSFHYTKTIEYLEQLYSSEDFNFCYIDFFTSSPCTAQPVADVPMLGMVYMVDGTVPCNLSGFGEITLHHGFAYLLYLPAEAIHQVNFVKSHYRVVFCYFPQAYLESMASENQDIADLLKMFETESPLGLIGKAASIDSNALYQMWLIQQCNESPAYQKAHLKARGLDLVLNYVKQSSRPPDPENTYTRDSISRNVKVFQAKKIIDGHDNGKLLIEEIARKVGLNEQQLKKVFKQTFKITIGKYQADTRFARACTLLAETDLYIGDIALRIGYQDESSLTRTFKQRLQITPQRYRMHARTNF